MGRIAAVIIRNLRTIITNITTMVMNIMIMASAVPAGMSMGRERRGIVIRGWG